MRYNEAMKKTTVSVVCPTYNEAGIAAKMLARLYTLTAKHIAHSEIVVIDDGSTDGNLAQLKAFTKGKTRIRIIPQTPNQGIAVTLRRLYTEARNEWIIVFSLDGEWDPTDVIRFYERLSAGDTDMVIGERREKQYTAGRKLFSWLYNKMVSIFFGVKTYDAGSLKAMHTNIVHKVPIISIGVFDEAERIIRASRMGYRICVIPINHLPTKKPPRVIPRPVLVRGAILDMFRVWISLNFWE